MSSFLTAYHGRHVSRDVLVAHPGRPGRCGRASSSRQMLTLFAEVVGLVHLRGSWSGTANWPAIGEAHQLTLMHRFTAAPTQSHIGSSNEARQAVVLYIHSVTQSSLLQYQSKPIITRHSSTSVIQLMLLPTHLSKLAHPELVMYVTLNSHSLHTAMIRRGCCNEIF